MMLVCFSWSSLLIIMRFFIAKNPGLRAQPLCISADNFAIRLCGLAFKLSFTKSKNLLLLLNLNRCEQQKPLNSLNISLINFHFLFNFYFPPSIKSHSNAWVWRLSFNVSWILNDFPWSIFRTSFISRLCCARN